MEPAFVLEMVDTGPAASWDAFGPEKGRTGAEGPEPLSIALTGTSSGEGRVSGPIVRIAVGGSMVQVKRPGHKSGSRGKRTRITAFSKVQRRGLINAACSVDLRGFKAGDLWLVTLTYREDGVGPARAKKDLKRFFRRVRVWLPGAGAIWRLESQKRGCAHVHVLFVVGRSMTWGDNIRFADDWCWAIGGGEMEWRFFLGMLKDRWGKWNEPGATPVQDLGRLRQYLAKYMGKDDQVNGEWTYPGKLWGYWRKGNIPYSIVDEPVSEEVATEFQRLIRRSVEHQPTGKWRIRIPGVGVDRRRLGLVATCDGRREFELPSFEKCRSASLVLHPSLRFDIRPYHVRLPRMGRPGSDSSKGGKSPRPVVGSRALWSSVMAYRALDWCKWRCGCRLVSAIDGQGVGYAECPAQPKLAGWGYRIVQINCNGVSDADCSKGSSA